MYDVSTVCVLALVGYRITGCSAGGILLLLSLELGDCDVQ